jgi:hypothetical protein
MNHKKLFYTSGTKKFKTLLFAAALHIINVNKIVGKRCLKKEKF